MLHCPPYFVCIDTERRTMRRYGRSVRFPRKVLPLSEAAIVVPENVPVAWDHLAPIIEAFRLLNHLDEGPTEEEPA